MSITLGRRDRPWVGTIFFGITVLLLAVIAGLISVSGSPMFIGAYAGLFVGGVLLFSPRLLFAVTVAVGMMGAGLAEFYLGIGQANWIASGLGLALGVAAMLYAFNSKPLDPGVKRLRSTGPLTLAFLVMLVVSSIVNQISWVQFAVGLRNYLPFLGILVALRYVLPERTLARIPYALVGIGLLQLPFCIHQAVFVAPMRAQSASARGGAAEAIVGTFGGDPLGGGYTGEMAVFVLLASCIALALTPQVRAFRYGFIFMPIAALACVAMAETKIVFVLTPFVLALVFLEEIRSSPRRFFMFLGGAGAALGVLTAVYAWRFWSSGLDEVIHAFTYSFDPDFMVTSVHRGRVAALIHWWHENVTDFDFIHILFGYGVAATLESSRVLGAGSAVKIFGYGLDAHAASKLLWDLGLFGFGLFLWIIVRTGLNAHRLLRIETMTAPHRAMLKVSRGAMFAFAAMLPYQVSVLGGAPMQVLFWIFVGYVEYWRCFAVPARS
ncbi:MAG: hypothetical protein Q8O08_03830 [Methyloversatilis sp.]|uniref:hypothetical protein n=1 Tax=Methyloversatilis sp. TaxID=2569862 RepID=UPI002736F567|nr:hypothetical protein [Methyloversatilis sp.]MDP2867931.1 hypothetical protein [Methyloversatilis sp.]